MRDQICQSLDQEGVIYEFDPSSAELTLPCPECADSRVHKLKLCFNVDKLVGHCWVCESRFSLGRLVQAFGLQGVRTKSTKKISTSLRRFDSLRSLIAKKAKHIKLLERRPLSAYPRALKYVRGRDVSSQVIKLFGLAVCSDDLEFDFFSRLIIPVKSERGLVVSYLGRSLKGETPKYRVCPGTTVFDFVFGAHLIKKQTTVVLFEGSFSVMRTYLVLKTEFDGDVIPVASFSHHLSNRQERVLQEKGISKVIIFYDGDSLTISKKLEIRLRRWAKVGRVELDILDQPDDLSPEEIVQRIAPFVERFKQTKGQQITQLFTEV